MAYVPCNWQTSYQVSLLSLLEVTSGYSTRRGIPSADGTVNSDV